MIPITERTAIEIALKKFNASMIRDFIRKEKNSKFYAAIFYKNLFNNEENRFVLYLF